MERVGIVGWFDGKGDSKSEKVSPSELRAMERTRRAVEESKIRTAELQAKLDLQKGGSWWDRFWDGL